MSFISLNWVSTCKTGDLIRTQTVEFGGHIEFNLMKIDSY